MSSFWLYFTLRTFHFFSEAVYSGNTISEAFFKATFLYLGWQSLQHVRSVFHQLPPVKIRQIRCFVTGTFSTATLSCAGLGISSKQQVLQSAVKKPAVFKGSNLVRKTSKQATLLGIELSGPEAVSALKSLSSLVWGRELSPAWHWPNPARSVSGSITSVLSGLCVHLARMCALHAARCTQHSYSLPPRSSLHAGHAETLGSSLSTHTGTSGSWMPNQQHTADNWPFLFTAD